MNSAAGTRPRFKSVPALLLAAVLGGCASAPAPQQVEESKPQAGCTQSDWQAQTAPVISKRQGNEALEKYRNETQNQGSGCR